MTKMQTYVVGGREDSEDGRKAPSGLLVHPVALVLRLVRTNDGEEIIPLEEVADGLVPARVGRESVSERVIQ